MATQADGKTTVLLTIGCEPGSEFCGECTNLLMWNPEERRWECPFGSPIPPETGDTWIRCPACLSAEAAAAKLVAESNGPRIGPIVARVLSYLLRVGGHTPEARGWEETLRAALAADGLTVEELQHERLYQRA